MITTFISGQTKRRKSRTNNFITTYKCKSIFNICREHVSSSTLFALSHSAQYAVSTRWRSAPLHWKARRHLNQNHKNRFFFLEVYEGSCIKNVDVVPILSEQHLRECTVKGVQQIYRNTSYLSKCSALLSKKNKSCM